MNETIFIASDHAGFDLKKQIINSMKGNFIDLGADNENSVDYPDYAEKLVSKIKSTEEFKRNSYLWLRYRYVYCC